MNNQTDIFEGYPQPKTYLQEILLTAILNGRVSLFDFKYLSDFRKYISDLRLKHGIIFKHKEVTKISKFGNNYTYRVHILTDKEHAENIYKQLCEK